MEILIKNMVCPRCIEAVRQSLTELEIPFETIQLGRITTASPLSPNQREKLSSALTIKGFELLETKNAALVSQIKVLIIEQIHHSDQSMSENFSTFISEKLNHEYTALSRLFSNVEGMTIEKFITLQKIERVKELLIYDQLSLSEIAFKMNYSSVAYLSSQFKKETGMTPSAFKKSRNPARKSLDHDWRNAHDNGFSHKGMIIQEADNQN
jgi:AraC-like DNA-binding protein